MVSRRACGRRGDRPCASISDLCALGGDSYFGLAWGWALLAYWRHLGGLCCAVTHVTRLVLMHVQRPEEAGCRLWLVREFCWLPLCGVVGRRWGADVTRLCVYLCGFPALVPACVYRPAVASLCNTLMSTPCATAVHISSAAAHACGSHRLCCARTIT